MIMRYQSPFCHKSGELSPVILKIFIKLVFLPLHKNVPEPSYRLSERCFIQIGIVYDQHMLVFGADALAEFRKARNIDPLFARGPFDLNVGKRGVDFHQKVGSAFSAFRGDDREVHVLPDHVQEGFALLVVVFSDAA